jgi:hypothetical protein
MVICHKQNDLPYPHRCHRQNDVSNQGRNTWSPEQGDGAEEEGGKEKPTDEPEMHDVTPNIPAIYECDLHPTNTAPNM